MDRPTQFEAAGVNGNNYDVESSAKRAAGALDDSGLQRAVAEEIFGEELKKADEAGVKQAFIKSVDEKEEDGTGLDLIARYDKNQVPTEHQVIPNQWHSSAKEMAKLMDDGKMQQAMDLHYKMWWDVKTDFPGFSNMLEHRRQMNRWMFTIDYYEQSQKGYDVNIYQWPMGEGEPRFDFFKLKITDK